MKDLKGAIESYEKLIEINPNNQNVYLQISGVKMDLEDFDGAIKIYEKLIKDNPKDSLVSLYKSQIRTANSMKRSDWNNTT